MGDTVRTQEINRYLKNIIGTMNEGLLLIAPDGTIMMLNKAFEDLTGFRQDELIGRPCTLLKCDACETTWKDTQDVWCTLFERGEVIKKRCSIMKKDGTCLTADRN